MARSQPLSIQHNSTRSRKCSDVDIIDKPLEAFIGAQSVSFLVSKWSELEAYQKSLKTVQALEVVNDSAERAIAPATEFNSSATKQEEQKQFLFQTVESHRKQFPNCKKSTLIGKPMNQTSDWLITEMTHNNCYI
jgi:hypothetical protein